MSSAHTCRPSHWSSTERVAFRERRSMVIQTSSLGVGHSKRPHCHPALDPGCMVPAGSGRCGSSPRVSFHENQVQAIQSSHLMSETQTKFQQSSISSITWAESQPFVSPLRHELVRLQIATNESDEDTSMTSTNDNNVDLNLHAVQVMDAINCPVVMSNGRRRTAPDMSLSSIEKIRLQEFYSPAQFSLTNVNGLNLADIDPSNPFVPNSSTSPIPEGTPLRTPRLLRRNHSSMKLQSSIRLAWKVDRFILAIHLARKANSRCQLLQEWGVTAGDNEHLVWQSAEEKQTGTTAGHCTP
ncbi:unnamed protein product [Echinostoma caproni]|uniref:Uncharacterized protein n=1 Tax=Echinostoma caproni TaxID=27848 RepID=A0A183AY07_9TREM|nr:unnamed protein product [Echinostoma caproni]